MASSSHDIGDHGAEVSGAKDRDFDSLIAHEGQPPKKRPRPGGAVS